MQQILSTGVVILTVLLALLLQFQGLNGHVSKYAWPLAHSSARALLAALLLAHAGILVEISRLGCDHPGQGVDELLPALGPALLEVVTVQQASGLGMTR